MKLSAVVAAYDEAGNIEPLFRRLEKTLTTMPGVTPEAIFVVEGRDGTREALERLTAQLPWVRILYHEAPTGLGAAFRRGFAAVSEDADYVVTLDADLNHQPEEIPRLLAAAVDRGSDVLVGSRFVAGGKVEGTPFWKSVLSRGVNALMRGLYGLEVRDKTSGFRVYRAEVLREVGYRNDAFAFLPELLIAAGRAGYRIAEEPIRFTFRREGTSKMAFWPTSWSYLRLLRTRFDRWSLAVTVLLALGLALRLGLAFPTHRNPADADCILNGLCAFKVLRGETPVFSSYFRLGSLGSHLTALLFALGGVSRATLATGPVIFGGLLMGVWYLFMREIFDRRTAAVALLFIAVPAPALSYWTYMPNGYPEILFLCGATLWLAARAISSRRRWPFLALGLAVGLGVWSSLQTLGCSVPALIWLSWHRWRDLLRRGLVLLFVGGWLLGAAPWLAFNLRYNFPALRHNVAARVTPGLQAGLDNVRYLVSYKLPEMVANAAPRKWSRGTRGLRWVRVSILGIHLTAAVLFFYRLSGRRKSGRSVARLVGAKSSPRLIFALLLVTMVTVNVVSAAGMSRGPTVRYILPLYLIVPGLLAVSLRWLATVHRLPAIAAAGAVLVFNLAGSHLPWTQKRQLWSRDAAETDRLMEVLHGEKVGAVLGNYWLVYPINFYSQERIHGIPWRPVNDHYRIERRLDAAPVRWALVLAADLEPAFSKRIEKTELASSSRRIGSYTLFVFEDRVAPQDFLPRLRTVYHDDS